MGWKKWLRALLAAGIVLIAIAGAALWLLLHQINSGAAIGRVSAQFQALTGRTLAIDGPVRLRLFPSIALVVRQARLGNADGGSQPEMARIDEIACDIALKPLFNKRIEIDRIHLTGADLLLETDPQGRGNWHFARGAGEAPPRADSGLDVSLREFLVRDSQLRYRSGRSGHVETLRIHTLALRATGTPGADAIEIAAQLRGEELQVQGQLSGLRAAFTDKRPLPFDLGLRFAGADFRLQGALPIGGGAMQLRFEGHAEQAAPLARLLGFHPPVPMPADAAGTLRLEAGRIAIDDFRLATQGQDIDGRIVWNHGAEPKTLALTLHAARLELARLLPAPQAGAAAPKGGGAPDARLFSDAPFAPLRLPRLATEVDLRIERLALPNAAVLGALRARLTTRGEQLELQSLGFELAGGRFTLSGSARLPADAPPRGSLRLKARAVEMATLMALAMRRPAPITGGRADIDAQLSASGRSAHALAASLSGELRLRMGAASTVKKRLLGPDDLLEAPLRALMPIQGQGQGPGGTLQLRCAAARLPLRAGVATIDRSIAIDAHKTSLTMSGRIDLGSERIDLTMQPRVNRGTGLDPASFASLVRIGGSLGKPTVEMDLAGTTRRAVEIGAAVASSGATLLGQRLIERADRTDPCAAALAEPAPKKAPSAPARLLEKLWPR